jgi:hypothetical protein
MPKGVEHTNQEELARDTVEAKGSVMPKGVEHLVTQEQVDWLNERKDQ